MVNGIPEVLRMWACDCSLIKSTSGFQCLVLPWDMGMFNQPCIS